MAYKDFEGFNQGLGENSQDIKLDASSADTINLPDESFVRDADIIRDGMDLVLDGPNGHIIIEDYFAVESAPTLVAPSGATLTPELVDSFSKSTPQYAKSLSMNDASPVGAVDEISGDTTVTRTDGTTEHLSIGSPIYQGDVVETSQGSAVNITFSDESSFAVSEDTRLAIDEYVFDPASEAGTQNFSVLKGVFVFTSGLIGREDPDDVQIDTPAGSIGIRGTIIAGDVNSGEITVVEGAIVLRDPSGFEMTLASQFETGKFSPGGGVENLGQMSANDVIQKFSVVSKVAPTLFSSINDAAAEGKGMDAPADDAQQPQDGEQPTSDDQQKDFDAEGATDQDGDSQVDGTVDETKADGEGEGDGQVQQTADGTTEQQSEPLLQEPMLKTAEPLKLSTPTTTQTTLTKSALPPPPKAPAPTQTKTALDPVVTNTLTDPNALKNTGDTGNKTPPPPPNQAPEKLNPDVQGIPAEYFTASASNHWHFNFNEVFADKDAGDTLTYSLQAQTVGILDGNATTSNGIDLTTLLDTSSGANGGWSFDASAGALDLFFNSDTTTSGWDQTALTSDDSFIISITATDTSGASITDHYTFNLVGKELFLTPGDGNIGAANPDNVFSTNVAKTYTVSGTNPMTLLTGDGNDTIDFMSGTSGNTVHTGDGNDLVTLNNATTDNTITTGYGDDTVTLSSVDETRIFTMHGNDTFVIQGTQLTGMQSGGFNNMFLDAGNGNLNILGGDGDVLKLTQDGNLDFGLLAANGHQFKNFEIINTHDTTTNTINTVTLNYNDVIQMTDGRNKLVINMDANDTLNFDHDGHGDNVADGTQNIGGEAYNVYHFNDVTLLVSQDTGTVNIGNPA